MNKRVALFSSRGFLPSTAFSSTTEVLRAAGGNTGNLMFQYAAYNAIDDEKILIGRDVPWNADVINRECDVAVLPAANFIREGFEFDDFVNVLSNLKIPVIILGLGIQAKNFKQTEFNFSKSVLRFIDLCKEHGERVGLRGKFTQAKLESWGVEGTSIIGCPSNFINPRPSFVDDLEAKWNMESKVIIGNGDEPWPKDIRKRDVDRQTIRWALESGGYYVQQSVEPLVRFARQYNPAQTEQVPDHHLTSIRNAITPDMTDDEFAAFMASGLRLYYSADQWMEDAARVHFSIGTRLHGNMAAWQAGTPSIWIYHDSRTRELADIMRLPSISHIEFLNSSSFADVKEKVALNYKFERYARSRRILCKRMRSILTGAGLTVSKHIDQICDQPVGA